MLSLLDKFDELLDSNNVAQDGADGTKGLAARLLSHCLAQLSARAQYANVCHRRAYHYQ